MAIKTETDTLKLNMPGIKSELFTRTISMQYEIFILQH